LTAGETDMNQTISLQFEEIPIRTILNMIAEKYGLNIVQSAEITEEISIHLNNVALISALDAILTSNGYNYFYSDDIIVVKPLDMAAMGELKTVTRNLKYISPAAAANAVSDLLSGKGTIKVVGEKTASGQVAGGAVPTRVVITDLPGVIARVISLIDEIDIPEPQLAIEVSMVEVNVDSDKRVGVNWPTQLVSKLHGAGSFTAGSTSGGSTSTGSEALGQMDLPDGQWKWGKLSVEETRIMLDFLDKSGNSKLISDPRITTLNNHEAEIKVTTVIPIQTINRFSEGGSVQDIVSFQDEEVGITLRVTPHISDDDEIILDVNPSVAEIIGYSGPAESQKPITSERSVRCKISVRDGETAVLGGLLKENKIEIEQKIFLIGSLPIIGNLFKHKSTQVSTTDLMVLITPTILKD
jgi:type IV pilus secretin PilQ/predicted competence protein